MKNIIIGFSRPKNKIFPWFSWLIRLVQDTDYSHTYIQISLTGIDEVMTFQASGLQVNIVGNEYFNANEMPIYKYSLKKKLSAKTKQRLLNFCFKNAGKPYSILEVFKIALSKLFKFKVKKESQNQKSWVCSELIACILEDILDIDMKIDFTLAEPKDIQLFLENCPLFIKIL